MPRVFLGDNGSLLLGFVLAAVTLLNQTHRTRNLLATLAVPLLILLVAGFLAPVPILMLHIVEALVQAYLFGMLALIYIASGVQTHKKAKQAKKE